MSRPDDFEALRDRAVGKLQALVRIPTVSHADPEQRDEEPFVALRQELRRHFPQLHSRLELVPIPGHALLMRWPARSGQRSVEPPVVLMAHLDVVPIDETAPWRHPAWAARVADGQVWGRGTLDDKGPVVAICEAVERLLEQGFAPARDVWISLGSTEEVSGETAALAVEELARRGVEPWFVLDEGGAIASEAFPGVSRPLGVIGVAEKGITSLELRVEGRGGHASTPMRMDATARLARAVLRVDRRAMPPRLLPHVDELFRRLVPHASPALRPVLTALRHHGPTLARALTVLGPETSAMVRTTIATTMLTGSPASNVIASQATATLNVRVLPGDTVDDVVAHVERSVRDPQVGIRVLEAGEATDPSPVDDDAFRLIEATIGEVFPDAVPTPYLMMAGTDSRFFSRICPRIYRFAPLRMTREQRASLHSFDERVGVDDLADGVLWFESLLRAL